MRFKNPFRRHQSPKPESFVHFDLVDESATMLSFEWTDEALLVQFLRLLNEGAYYNEMCRRLVEMGRGDIVRKIPPKPEKRPMIPSHLVFKYHQNRENSN